MNYCERCNAHGKSAQLRWTSTTSDKELLCTNCRITAKEEIKNAIRDYYGELEFSALMQFSSKDHYRNGNY